jgi:bile acid:Na+ symporter, BASS family
MMSEGSDFSAKYAGRSACWPTSNQETMTRLSSFTHFLHTRLLWLLVAVYLLAALVPGPALTLRGVSLPYTGTREFGIPLTLPALLLAALLFNAGLGARFIALRRLRQSSFVLGVATIVNLAAPVLVISAASLVLRWWHSPAEFQNILTGLVLIASMPIAGSSTAWAHNAEGDLTVSLGLVMLSTALSPVTTPLLLHAGSWLTAGDWSRQLDQLSGQGTGGFLLLFVLAPSLAGILARVLLGEHAMERIQPPIKVANSTVLLLLCYMNAAVSLPQIVANPDADFLAVVLLVTVLLCVLMFAAGWFLARALHVSRDQRAPLVFGLGMNNNGTGLVVASGALPNHPLVLVPILLYNLIQHLAAGIAERLLSSKPPTPNTHARPHLPSC